MLKIIFFAQTRELVDCDSVDITFEAKLSQLENIRQLLVTRGDKWDLALQREKLLVAVNQTMSPWDTLINDGDEIAFFPPVTGG
ncbi:MAG: molybdopterin synthase sulfur carrier subunit [Gammaproteobacteria bacterium]|nr:molybdopterin synthase sulfur carrier subunit [Gammaproteobacteria bacterium]